jgi:DHA1 family multidrug resistance protein-like MFS transporter
MATDPMERETAWSWRQVVDGLPLFFVFFMWSFGSGAIQLARPLFAFEVTESIFLVAVMVSVTGTSRIVSAPLTGFLTDRFGRKPLILFGAGLRGAGSLGQFFVDSYAGFVILEFIAQAGVSIFITGITVHVSDVTTRENRGRFLAVRTLSSRIGQIAGPAVGGLIAGFASLQHVFLFDSITKFAIVIVVLVLIRESRPSTDHAKAPRANEPGRSRFDLSPFMHATFLALGASVVAGTLLQQGITYSVLPVHASESVGLTPEGLGALVSMAALLGVLVAYPNGILSDRFGRKFSLAPGLLILAVGTTVLAISPSYVALALAMAAFGIGEGMVMGTTQAFAMDLAPTEGRGAFLGIWSLVRSISSVLIPLGIGGLYAAYSPQGAFLVASAWLVVSAVLVITIAKESGGRGASGE